MTAQHHFAVRLPDLTAFPRELEDRIHVHGLHLKTAKEVQVGETVAVQFRFPQREDPLCAEGVIAWVAAQPDAQGKRSLVVRHLKFDAEAERIIELVRTTPAVEEADLPRAASVVPPPPPSPRVVPVPELEPAPEILQANATGDGATDDAAAQKKRRIIMLGAMGLLLVLLLGWLFALGGLRWVQMTFLPPPPPLTVGPRDLVAQPEPPLAKPKPAPAPVRVPPTAVATNFDYFQRPAMNEFILTFNRPLSGKIVERRSEDPLMHTYYIERADTRLDKDQYFLSFDMVRTVLFEHESGVLRVSFIAQNAHYLPQPVHEVRGRELVIRFIAQD